jgi:hypothetical protein
MDNETAELPGTGKFGFFYENLNDATIKTA